jgi:hypothetical protein
MDEDRGRSCRLPVVRLHGPIQQHIDACQRGIVPIGRNYGRRVDEEGLG